MKVYKKYPASLFAFALLHSVSFSTSTAKRFDIENTAIEEFDTPQLIEINSKELFDVISKDKDKNKDKEKPYKPGKPKPEWDFGLFALPQSLGLSSNWSLGSSYAPPLSAARPNSTNSNSPYMTQPAEQQLSSDANFLVSPTQSGISHATNFGPPARPPLFGSSLLTNSTPSQPSHSLQPQTGGQSINPQSQPQILAQPQPLGQQSQPQASIPVSNSPSWATQPQGSLSQQASYPLYPNPGYAQQPAYAQGPVWDNQAGYQSQGPVFSQPAWSQSSPPQAQQMAPQPSSPQWLSQTPPQQLPAWSAPPPPQQQPAWSAPPPQQQPAWSAPSAQLQPSWSAPPPQEHPAWSAPPTSQQQPAWSAPPPQQHPAWSAPPPQQQPAWSAPPPQQQPAWSAPPPQQQPAWSAPPPKQPPSVLSSSPLAAAQPSAPFSLYQQMNLQFLEPHSWDKSQDKGQWDHESQQKPHSENAQTAQLQLAAVEAAPSQQVTVQLVQEPPLIQQQQAVQTPVVFHQPEPTNIFSSSLIHIPVESLLQQPTSLSASSTSTDNSGAETGNNPEILDVDDGLTDYTNPGYSALPQLSNTDITLDDDKFFDSDDDFVTVEKEEDEIMKMVE